MKLKVVKLRQTCEACPAQWEGETSDGRHVYVRFRWGVLNIGVGKTAQEAVENYGEFLSARIGDSLDGWISYTALVELTKDKITWPRS